MTLCKMEKDFLELSCKYGKVLETTLEANNALVDAIKAIGDAKEMLRKTLNEGAPDPNMCPVCMERPRVRVLSCGHCFCAACAGRLMRADGGVGSPAPSGRCPTCRAPIFRSMRVFI